MFQQAHGITDDGLITLPTLLKLNDSLKIDKTLFNPRSRRGAQPIYVADTGSPQQSGSRAR